MTSVHPGWTAYFAFGALFAPMLKAGATSDIRLVGAVDLERLLALAAKNGATSALAWALRDHDLPEGLRRNADAVLAAAREAAGKRVAGIEAVAGALNAIGVRPLLLKGCAAQVGGIYPDPGFRTMSDIDLLVPLDRFEDSVAAVERIGFTSRDDGDYGHTHAPQHHPALGVTIEIHRRLAPTHAPDNLPAAALLERAHPARLGSAEVLLPDWVQHAVTAILHTLVWDRTRYTAFVPLKPMLDLAALKASGVPMDWTAVARALEAIGERTSLEHVETLFRAFFGAPLTGHAVPKARAARVLRYYRIGATHPIVVTIARLRFDLGARAALALRRPALLGRLVTPALYLRLATRVRLAWRES